ncbi:MAG: sensor histidine kinase, partial [Bacteroidota bacterium]
DLEAVNLTPESPSLYASMTTDGNFTYLSDKFLSMMEYEVKSPPKGITELLKSSEYPDDFIEGLHKILRKRKNWTGELCLINEPGDFCWLETHFIPTQLNDETKLIAKNITEFKEATLRSRELNKERIEKSVKAQQYRSALILQGQEEERKRLSQEMHDGIGQMLSAMKLLLESLTASSSPQRKRLMDAKSLMKSIIQEVRRVSFNLTPSSLSDFGLVPAISKFCEEINAVAKSEIRFVNETRFINRLDTTIETNLYRIIQEAVNNALKYAKSSEIVVKFCHSIRSLSICIEDDGKGFDYERVEKSGHFKKAGHGIFNMNERAAYIGGSFEIQTELEKGTRILITLPLNQND